MRAGRILLVLLFVLGLLGVVFNGAAIYSRFFLLSVSILGIAWVWTRWSAQAAGSGAGCGAGGGRRAGDDRGGVDGKVMFEQLRHAAQLPTWSE